MPTLEELQYPIGPCQYPEVYTDAILQKMLQDIETFPKRLELEVQNLLEFQLQTPYRENGWTVNQVIHHCADSHMNFILRLKLALSEVNPTIKPYREEIWAEMADYELPFNNSITLLFCIHQKIMKVLRSLTSEQLDRTYFHPQYERSFQIKELICLYSWHGNHHLAHISTLKERMKW
mgnify:FL=1|jgi:hypothetical protein